jgi:hypothetical protein
MTKKKYCVSIPVAAQVSVYVEADNEEQAIGIAEKSAHPADAEPIDFTGEESFVEEVDKFPRTERVYGIVDQKIKRVYPV